MTCRNSEPGLGPATRKRRPRNSMSNRDRQRDSVAPERGHGTAYLALETWRRELANRERSSTTVDPLCRAACAESLQSISR